MKMLYSLSFSASTLPSHLLSLSIIAALYSNLGGVFVSGTAGCVATLLHDAAMNPSEGKDNT